MNLGRTNKILISVFGVLLLLTLMSSTGLAQITLTSGVPVSGSGTAGQMIYYQISTSATDSKLEVSMTGLSADLDLYVRGGALPTSTVYDCRPYLAGTSSETCSFNNPGAKTWYILVHAYQAGNYTIKATITGAEQVSMCMPAWNQKLPAAERFVVVMDGAAVLDKETGLTWDRNLYPGYRYWEEAIEICYSSTIGGRTGWHLPTLEQLASLFDLLTTNEYMYLPVGHPFVEYPGTYWTSTTGTYYESPTVAGAWVIDFDTRSHNMTPIFINSTPHPPNSAPEIRAWCVRGGQTHDGK